VIRSNLRLRHHSGTIAKVSEEQDCGSGVLEVGEARADLVLLCLLLEIGFCFMTGGLHAATVKSEYAVFQAQSRESTLIGCERR
jgi:hypothetical protein